MIKKLSINFSSLTLLQISNYVFPLITFPYLVRVLGPEQFGLANFALAFLIYFNTIIDYGFHFSATRGLAQSNPGNISKIYNLTFFSKMILLLPVSVIYFIVIFAIPFFAQNIFIYLIVYLVLLGNALFPVWFFQGIEKMYYIAIFNIVFRAVGVVLIFLYVTNQKDILVYLLINSGIILFTGVTASFYIYIKKLADFSYPGLQQIKQHLKESLDLFTSQFFIMLYTTSNTFVLGLISGNIAVGYFTGADKIRNVFQNIGGIGGQTLFPHISKLYKVSKTKANQLLRKYIIYFGSLLLLACLSLFLFSNEIIYLILGSQYYESIAVLKIIAFLPLIIFLSNVFGIQFMLGQGYDKAFRKIIIFGSVINFILLLLLVPKYSAVGTALSMLITESIITFLTISFFIKNK